MVEERRVFNRLPNYLRTEQNNRATYVSDDVMFEPERADFLNGYIGDTSILTEEDLDRFPPVAEDSKERQKYQLSLGAVLVDPDTEERSGGAFYPDLVGQIDANGGITSDPNRLFETAFYAWSPPVDYDKHINFTRYYWTGAGNAQVNGEYVTKEPQGSKTVLFEVTAGGFISRDVRISSSAPMSPSTGDLWEDVSDLGRGIFQWDGNSWVGIPFEVKQKLPSSTSGFSVGEYVYVTRTGPDFNRPLMWKYSEAAGRWISTPVVVGPLPDSPTEGMIWEDASIPPNRTLKVYQNGGFSPINWTAGIPGGTPADGTIVFDERNLDEINDGWSTVNWWRHFDDLSPADREALFSGDQAVRPILEFWAGLDTDENDTRDFRNDYPRFNVYTFDGSTGEVVSTGATTTLLRFRTGSGQDDLVLGFPVSFNDLGEIEFELTLETDSIPSAKGYRYFVDTFTGLSRSVWSKSDELTQQAIDTDGLAEVPKNITANPNHEVLTRGSRSRFLTHMANTIAAQDSFEGNQFGLNNFRWTDKDPTTGATILDCENTLLRVLGTLQRKDLDIPTVIRRMARDYNRIIVKFQTRLTQLWENGTISDPTDTLYVTPGEVTNAILTNLFIGRGEDFAYFHSDMGTYEETQIAGGVATNIGLGPRPIFIPPSPARTGSAPTSRPEKFTDRDGITRLRGHDGTIIDAFNDARDEVWLELQNRFFNAIPEYYRKETSTFSSRFTQSNFYLEDYYGNSTPNTTNRKVVSVVGQYEDVVSPLAGEVYFDASRGQLAYYDGSKFMTKNVLVDDVFLNQNDNEYYIYNGFGVHKIERFNRPRVFDYTTEEFRTILRREFERWAVFFDADFITNEQYDPDDPFTWNYRSAGVEGNYMGIYRRIYQTVRPHSHPWEIVGYHLEPDWWRVQYVPDSVASDGTPRYGNAHPMWLDIQAGIYNPITGGQSSQHTITAPIPVDTDGELLDPIAANVVQIENLVQERLDDSWVYGDGSPVEQQFLNSPNYTFAVSLLGYLMKPGQFIDTVWSELYIDVGEGGSNPVWRAPHVVHRDTLTRPKVEDLPVHLEKVDGQVEQRLGINAWISEYSKLIGNDITKVFGDTLRNTQISPAWRCSGFINADRTVIQTLSGIRIPFEDMHTILHRSPPVKENFGSGVLVTREGTGYRVYGFDLFEPYFTVDIPVQPIAGGQVEFTETYTATDGQHLFETDDLELPVNTNSRESASFAVLINGLRLKRQHVRIEDKKTFRLESYLTVNEGDRITVIVLTTQSNPSTRVKQFVVDGVAYPYVDAGQGVTERIEYGRFFETASDVINFMLGYGRYLESQGWVFDEQVTTGVIRDWLYGAKQFATWVTQTTSPWPQFDVEEIGDFFFSPFVNYAKFESQFGQILNVEALQNGAYGVIDQNAEPIDPENTFTSRIGNQITLSRDEGTTEIYGVRLLVAEDQHVVFLSNVTKFNDLIYDPILDLFQTTLRVEAYRSLGWAGRLEADGFVINQGELLPNFEKQAKDFTRYYDRFNTLDDPVKRDQARELYGWNPNYVYTDPQGNQTLMMDAIGSEERSQFDYHRGMIHTKGSIRPLIAFSRGTRLGRDNAFVYEDWAWRWCEFGDNRRDVVQFEIDKFEYINQRQVIEFNSSENPLDQVIQVESFDRSNPNNGRWIIPPKLGENGIGKFEFPINDNGVFDRDGKKVFVKLFDTDTNVISLGLFHYDPENFLFDPTAITEIDYLSQIDPARYTNGPGAEYSNRNTWGSEQVGQYWWDTSRFALMDYRNRDTYKDIAGDWGKLLFYDVQITPVNQNAVVTTYDTYTGDMVPHGLSTGDVVEIVDASPSDYNGKHTIRVVDNTTFEYVLKNTIVTNDSTGPAKVLVGFLDLYEWIESPVRPSGWQNYLNELGGPGDITGTPINGDNTSYVTATRQDDRGNTRTFYYFWIRDNTGDNPRKSLRADQVAGRMENPTRFNSAWFGIVDRDHMITFVDGEQVQDDYAFEIVTDERVLDYHTEWVLISEGDQFNDVPEIIKDKLLDCLAGEDENGRSVPSSMLSDTEKYGTDSFPPQTVFVDRAAALSVYVEAVNRELRRENQRDIENITGLFDLANEGTYWSREEYRETEYEDKVVFDVVATESVRDTRLAQNRYAEGDLVKVIQSGNSDLWDGTTTDSTYVLQDGMFLEVGVNNSTVRIDLDETSSPDTIRDAFVRTYAILTKEQQNSLIFSLLYEMLRQSPEADWFMKTSYVSAQVFDTISQSPFVRPSEVEAIIANLLEYKPYRTKLRSSTFTYTVDQIEDARVSINEFPDKKISLVFDRLNCALEDEAGWDRFPWDTERAGWDRPFWYWTNLGRDEYFSVGVQTGSVATNEYVFVPDHDPTLYNHRVILRLDGEITTASDIGLSFEIEPNHTNVIVRFNGNLNNNITVELQQAGGFYQGHTPTLGPTFDDTLFRATPSTYEHHVARLMNQGIYGPFDGMDACVVDESPEERIPNDVEDNVVICVRTDWTSAYAGWDATPWDSTGWDRGATDIGPRVFYITAGAETSIAPGLAVFQTSQDVISTDDRFVAAGQSYRIAQVDLNGSPLTEGVDFEFLDYAPWIVEILPIEDIVYTADGATTSFDASLATNGIDQVFRNNVLQTEGVDYTISGTDVDWVQPAPTVQPFLSFSRGRHYTGNGSTDEFSTGIPGSGLNENNVFVFIDNLLVDTANYSVNGLGNVEFSTPPGSGEEVILFAIGNGISDTSPLFSDQQFTGDGTTTTYNPGLNANLITAWVFVDNVYQVLGTDYSIPSHGTIDFTTPPANGAIIEIRIYDDANYPIYDQEHIVFNASGSTSDPIPGLNDADPEQIVVFVGDQLQNAYSGLSPTDFTLSEGTPDQINWGTAPAPGTPVTVRVYRSSQIGQTTLINVSPDPGDNIRIVATPRMQPGDTVRFYYNDFPVGPLGSFTVTAAPTTYDVVNGVMILDNPVPFGFIYLNYTSPRRATNSRSILVRMTNVVDLALPDHEVFENTIGFYQNRDVGVRVLNTTDSRLYKWDGTGWVDMGVTLVPSDQVLVLRDQKILEYTGTSFTVVFNTGDSFTTPPVLQYPTNGVGIASGTYTLGQTANASVDFPEAYQIVQHPGDC